MTTSDWLKTLRRRLQVMLLLEMRKPKSRPGAIQIQRLKTLLRHPDYFLFRWYRRMWELSSGARLDGDHKGKIFDQLRSTLPEAP